MNPRRRRKFKMVKRLIHHNQKVIEMNTGSNAYQYRECIRFDICTMGAARSRRTEDARPSCISEHVERGNPARILEHNTKYVICKDDKCSSGNRMSQEANAVGRKATGIHNWTDRVIPKLKSC